MSAQINPAFSAIQSAAGTALNSSSSVKLLFDTEQFDTNGNFNLATDVFTPTVEGYYQITVAAMVPSNSTGVSAQIFKNGVKISDGPAGAGFGQFYSVSISNKLVYLNGSTDYIEAYAVASGSITTFPSANGVGTYFQGYMVRGV
jgi:hypothetical protein